jgi:hypothetical protein
MILATRVEQIGVQSVEAAGVLLCPQARQLAQLIEIEPPASGRNRHAGIFSRQPTFGSPDGANTGARRVHQKATKNTPQHRSAR